MLEWFASPERLGTDQGLDDLKRVNEVAQAFPACRVITVPAGQFQVEWGSPTATSEAGWREMQQRLIEKIRRYLEVVSGAGLKLAFEIGSPAGEVEQHYRQGLGHLQALVATPKGDCA
jgi:sugar phosphate isomerase/epimerase